MRNKILTILGLVIVVAAVSSYYFFDAGIRQHSEAFGVTVLVAREEIPEGTLIRDAKQAGTLFKAKRVPRVDVVPGAIEVAEARELSFWEKARSWFSVEAEASVGDLQALVNRRVTETVRKNEQVLADQLSTDLTEFAPNERLVAVPVTYVDAVGGEVHKGDWVDIWVTYRDEQTKQYKSQKIIGPLELQLIKTGDNQVIDKHSKAIPQVALFKMGEDQIALVSTWIRAGTVFLVKHGVTPATQTQLHVTDEPPAQATEMSDFGLDEILPDDLLPTLPTP